MATIEQVNLRLNDALLEANRELRHRLAAELWNNKRLLRLSQKYYQEVLELDAQIDELGEQLAELESELAELKRKMQTWEGD